MPEGFHLAERECVAKAIADAQGCTTLEELYAAIEAYDAHEVAAREPFTRPQTVERESPIMIVTEKPEAEDRQTGRPFSGEYGKVMRNACSQVGVDLDACHIAYAVHWTPGEEKAPNKTQLAASRPFIYREIELVRPRAILAQGRAVIESLANYRGSVLDIYGQAMTFRRGEIDVQMFMTAHPAYCLYSGTYFGTFVENLKDFFGRHGLEEEKTAPDSFKVERSINYDEPLFPRISKAA